MGWRIWQKFVFAIGSEQLSCFTKICEFSPLDCGKFVTAASIISDLAYPGAIAFMVVDSE
jgi:hypothetical protein